jgi:1,4-dihydroxy-2-naphthoate octaprenyltransferase
VSILIRTGGKEVQVRATDSESVSGSRSLGHPLPLLQRWSLALRGCNVPEVEKADAVSRWLVISRSCVLSMTASSALIGVLLAAGRGAVRRPEVFWPGSVLAFLGLLVAHASNNLLNDWTDSRRGVDTEDYPRARYSVHPILGGLTTLRGLLRAALILLGFDAAVMVALTFLSGWPILVFSGAGLLLSLAYTGFLKRFALGELASLVVWGPLMVAGTVFAASARWEPLDLLLSLPYGLVVASVLVGKHIDKLEADRAAGIRSLPVLIGERAALVLNKVLFLIFYGLIIALVAARLAGPGILLALVSALRLARTWKVYSQPRPEQPPEDWPVWPLWYVGWAMYVNRLAGMLFVAGLVVNLVLEGFGVIG